VARPVPVIGSPQKRIKQLITIVDLVIDGFLSIFTTIENFACR
jgi:hypothetical protein